MATTLEKMDLAKSVHDRVVIDIAKTRFALDGWEVAINPAQGSSKDLPDIVATNRGAIVATGEIETLESICEERAQQWKSYSESCARFYLFIPEGSEEDVVKLLNENQIHCSGLRTYSVNGKIDVAAVHYSAFSAREDDHPWWVEIGDRD